MAKKEGKLECGFKYSVDPAVLDDMELVDALAEAQAEDPTQISVVVKKILGPDQRKKLYDFMREKDGRVPVQKVTDAVQEIIESVGQEGKN